MAPRHGSISSNMLVGEVAPGEVAKAMTAVRDAGFFAIERYGYAVPDAASATLIAKSKDTAKALTWHELLLPGFGGDLNTDEEYRKFIAMWHKSAAALYALTPTRVERLWKRLQKERATHFRGFDPAQPVKAPWMHAKNWERKGG